MEFLRNQQDVSNKYMHKINLFVCYCLLLKSLGFSDHSPKLSRGSWCRWRSMSGPITSRRTTLGKGNGRRQPLARSWKQEP